MLAKLEPKDKLKPLVGELVFATARGTSRWSGILAVVVAAALHALLWVWSQREVPSLAAWSAALALRVHEELGKDLMVELVAVPPPPPVKAPPKATPPPKATAKAAVPSKAVKAPARASAIVAQAVDPNAPVDLTGVTFVTGKADAYAGGVTAATGTSAVAVKQVDLSSAVALGGQDWSCQWPREADAEDINEQTVVLRVLVLPNGSAESVTAATDPGHGFSQAAISCALKTKFTPAHNAQGQPVKSLSPPIRVRFTR